MTFGCFAETPVRIPKHLRLDTVLLTQGTDSCCFTLYTEKEKQPSQLGYDLIGDSNPLSLTL